MFNSFLKLSTILLLFTMMCLPLEAQFGNLKKSVKKAAKQNIKPLDMEFEVTDVSYNPMKSIDKLQLTLQFNGHNPNGLGVNIGRTEFDIFIDDKFAAKIYNDKKITIPKKGDFAFQEKTSIKISTVGKTVFKSIRDEQVVYRIEGTYFIQSPIGEFSFKVKLLEKEVQP